MTTETTIISSNQDDKPNNSNKLELGETTKENAIDNDPGNTSSSDLENTISSEEIDKYNPTIDQTQYGYVYRTTNTQNGQTYIGKHTIKPNEKWKHYLGSGKIIARSITKNGKEAFTKELLTYAANSIELSEKESILIIEEVKAGKGEYNIFHNHTATKIYLVDLKIDEQEILSWYFDDLMSWADIANKLDISSPKRYTYMTTKYKEIDPRFKDIKHGVIRNPETKERLKITQSKNLNLEYEKIACFNCNKMIGKNAIRSHEKACVNRNICSTEECNAVLTKKTAKHCPDHSKIYTFTSESNIRAGRISTHNRHHVNKQFYSEFCDLCVEYCAKENIPFTAKKQDIKTLIDNGTRQNTIAKIYNISSIVVYRWRKKLEEEESAREKVQ